MAQWDALSAGIGGVGSFADAFQKSLAARQMQERQAQMDQLARQQYADKMDQQMWERGYKERQLAQMGTGAYNLGQLLGLPSNDPRAGIPVSAKQAPMVVSQGLTASQPSEGTTQAAAQSSAILGGVSNLGKLAREAAEESKGGAMSIPLMQDIVPGLQGSFPSTASSVAPKLANYLSNAQMALDAIGRERSGGAITGEEWLSFRQFIPMPIDYSRGPEAVKQKLDALTNEYTNKLRAKADSIKSPLERQRWLNEKLGSVEGFRQQMYQSFLPNSVESPGIGGGGAEMNTQAPPSKEQILQSIRARRAALQGQQGRQ